MVDDGIKSALLFLNYNIGASGREEYKGKQGAVALNSAAVPFSCTFFEVVLMQFLMKPLETTAFIKKQKPPPLLGSGDSW